MYKNPTADFSDIAYEVRLRKIKSDFFDQINTLIDWNSVRKTLKKHYKKGLKNRGQVAYDPLLLFKISLLQTWYGLSDYEVEDRVNDSISFSRFCGLGMGDTSPDHSTISRFRTEMTNHDAYEELLLEINEQLKNNGIAIKKGMIVDASIVETPLKPKGKKSYEASVCEEKNLEKASQEELEKEPTPLKRIYPKAVDKEADWTIKAGKPKYGYKKHVLTNQEGLILKVSTTSASVSDTVQLEELLQDIDLPQGIPLYADKGYQSKKNKALLEEKQLKNRIMKKASKNRKLSSSEVLFNKICSKTRYKIERTFGSIKRWFSSVGARYRGLKKMHTQNLLESIAYNLYRSPGIIMSNCLR